ncbi:UbiA family prenyltransferase [Kocuria turfanensis]|uniref:UbiA family prenyltransferase n=1 Tax=Kocuria turfanensis TaxID=388357 RepID=UPI0040365F09
MPAAGPAPALRRMIHISRPVLWINTLGPGVLGMWLTGSLLRWEAVPLLLWLTLPFNLLIYGVNDIFDQDTDALNPRKGSLEGARIRSSEVRMIWVSVLATNLPFVLWFALALPPAALGWIALYVLVFVFYSAPPLRFKARPFLDSLSNAAYAFPLVILAYALGDTPVWPAALGLMAWSVAKHAFDAVQDIEEDRAVDITTTAVRLGARGTGWWSGAWWAVSVLGFALVSVPVAVVNALIAGWLVLSLLRAPAPATGHRLYRHSIAFPYVAGTVAGVQLAGALILGRYP